LSYFSVHKFTGTLSAALEIPYCFEDMGNNICCRVRTDSHSCWSWAVLRIRIRIPLYTLMQIRILLLLFIKMIRIFGLWSTDPPRLQFEPSWLHFEPPLPSIPPVRASILLSFWPLSNL
jgi:hypothetical protein